MVHCEFNLKKSIHLMFSSFLLFIAANGNVFNLLFGPAVSAVLKIIIVCSRGTEFKQPLENEALAFKETLRSKDGLCNNFTLT